MTADSASSLAVETGHEGPESCPLHHEDPTTGTQDAGPENVSEKPGNMKPGADAAPMLVRYLCDTTSGNVPVTEKLFRNANNH
ncbi:hypothetical protein JDV02_003301 [Purpureocillium takamizusanense]|uniref:Uncharacterized protein n=1 Tax=Purpureocillium takamizusanense TaxID=2060973 RepID=A0A9Q8QBB2_9HYPO|nr:uncharacterized protein JDV02_003301 [Purpureocillium takamizusanense]UNI16913.1 hypothetical protein JDV02_003301 [Purpureocillium takamizusanense]